MNKRHLRCTRELPRRHHQLKHALPADLVPPLKNALALLDRSKVIAMATQIFRAAEEQIAAWPQCVVKNRYELVLNVAVEIDQQVAAGNQIDARERRIADYAVRREDAEVADLLGDGIGLGVGGEIAIDAL